MGTAIPARPTQPADVVLAGALAVFLSLHNNVIGNQPWHRRRYVAANLGATGLLLGVGAARGFSADEMGLGRSRAPAGARLGGALALTVVGGIAAALVAPATRPHLRDARVGDLGWPAVARHAAVRVPVGTVVWEETAFRGVLQAALSRALPPGAAVAASSVLFGLWHVRPTLDAVRLNALGRSRRGTVAAVTAGVVVTALAGTLLTGLRVRSGSLLAPALVHLATNSASTLAAALAHRWR